MIGGCVAGETPPDAATPATAITPHDAPAATDAARAGVAGVYVLPDAFEMALGLQLLEDGTFRYALSVGALDQRSQGNWALTGNRITLTTLPTPVAPEFRRLEDDPSADAPFVMVTWSNGNELAGIDVLLSCANGATLSGYTQYDGWTPDQTECDQPLAIQLEEDIHRISSPPFDISGAVGGLRFELVPNDFGVLDMTGTQGAISGDMLTLELMGQQTLLRRLPDRAPPAPE